MTLRPPTGSSVLLYSGGLDSYILAALFHPDTLLHVNLHGRYGDTETVALRAPASAPPVIQTALNLGQWEDHETLILPGRNAILCIAAANYGDRIWLGATAGDRTKDKDPIFASEINGLLSYMFSDQWWLKDGRDVRVELPIKSFTKRELVAKYVHEGLDTHALVYDTFSCYAPDHDGVECGTCKPCVRKWVALVVNGVEPKTDARAGTIARLAEGMFAGRGDELADVLEALDLTGGIPL
jgi:7-cyano-7-deazaguanine synthase in queuosine biosynthesis